MVNGLLRSSYSETEGNTFLFPLFDILWKPVSIYILKTPNEFIGLESWSCSQKSSVVEGHMLRCNVCCVWNGMQ